MVINLNKSRKFLEHIDDHFQGYWVQLQSLIQQNDITDEILDDLLINPLEILIDSVEYWEGQREPDNTEEVEI